jgi:hypothetical protein
MQLLSQGVNLCLFRLDRLLAPPFEVHR